MTVDVRPGEDIRIPDPLAHLAPASPEADTSWVRICPVSQLQPDRGVAALVGREQVAVFLLSAPPEVYAIDNRDPVSQANVMARGLVGSVGDRPVVASPIFKERFDLRDGTCLDSDLVVRTWPVRIQEDWVEVAGEPGSPSGS